MNNKKGAVKNGLKINANIDWNAYTQQFKNVNDKDLYQSIEAVVLQTNKNRFKECD